MDGTGDPLGVFRPELLDASDARRARGRGGWCDRRGRRSRIASARVVGVSNLFASVGSLGDAWSGALAAVSVAFPGLEMVGYEPDEMLDAARRAGFRSIGPLRIWIKD